MTRISKILAAKIFTVFLLFASPASGAGIPTVDSPNLTQTTVTAFENVMQTLKQLQQYETQLQQYEDQIKNTAVPAMYIWAKAQDVMRELLYMQASLEGYMSQVGGVDAYLKRFLDPNAYSHLYGKFEAASSNAERAKYREEFLRPEADGLEGQRKSAEDALRTLEKGKLRLKEDAATLERLQSAATSAEGRNESLQYSLQFASQLNNQMLQIRGAMAAQLAVLATQAQTQQTRESRQAEADKAALKRPENLKTKSPSFKVK